MAGPSSVRPNLERNASLGAVGEEDSEGELEGEFAGEACERIGLPGEEEHLKRIKDPKLPSQSEVEAHYLMAHLPFRSWCPVCVQSKGKEMDHTKEGDGE